MLAFMMPGATEIALILLVVTILFGLGKLPSVLGDLGRGLRQFREAAREMGADSPPRP